MTPNAKHLKPDYKVYGMVVSRPIRTAFGHFGIAMCVLIAASCSGAESQSQSSELLDQIADLQQQVADLKQAQERASSTSTTEPERTTSTQASTTTTTTVAPEIVLLMSTYEWDERSEEVRELQELIGVTSDGHYGAQTWAAHLAALTALGLDDEHMPERPVAAPSSSGASTSGGSSSGSGATSTEAPAGGLIFERCSDCGQGFSSSNCANWKVRAFNSSDLTVSSFTFAPPGAYWRDMNSGWENRIEIPADAPGRTLAVNLAPYSYGTYQFQICTTTPRPTSPGDWEYSNLAPRSVSLTWANGATGTSCYNLGCF